MKKSITLFLSVIVLVSLLLSQSGASASPIPPVEMQEKTGRSSSQTAGFWESAERSSAASLSKHTTSGTTALYDQADTSSVFNPGQQPPVDGARRDDAGRWLVDSRTVSDNLSAPHSPAVTGGPDAFGYTWEDNVTVSWIAATQDVGLGYGSSGQAVQVSLPFTFPYYEYYYNDVYITGYGYLGMDWNEWWTDQDQLLQTRTPNNVIAPYWTPFNLSDTPGGDGRVYYESGGTSPDQWFAAEWRGMVGIDGDTYTFEVILHENGDIDFVYLNVDVPGGAWCGTSGIEDSTGQNGLINLDYCYYPGYLDENSAVHFDRPDPRARVSITPLYQGQFIQTGQPLDFSVPIRNWGDLGTDCYDLTYTSAWSVELLDTNYTALTDTCGTGAVDTGNIGQANTGTIILRLWPADPIFVGDQESVELTATSSLDAAVEVTTNLTGASPAPFVQAFNDTTNGRINLEYIQSQSSYLANPYSWMDVWNSGSTSVVERPSGGYVVTFTVDRCDPATCEFNFTEIHVAILDAQGRLLYPIRKVTDHTGRLNDVYDLYVVPAVDSEGNIGLVWVRQEMEHSTWTENYNIHFTQLNPDGTTQTPETALTNNTTWGHEWEDGFISLMNPDIAVFTDGEMTLSWEEILWSSYDPYRADVWLSLVNDEGIQAPVKLTSSDNINKYNHPSQTSLDGNLVLLSYIHDGVTAFITLDNSGAVVTSETIVPSGNAGHPKALQFGDEILFAWEQYDAGSQLHYALMDSSTYAVDFGPVQLTNPAEYDNRSISLTKDDDGNGILTWESGDRQTLYYALLDADGNVLTDPMPFHHAADGNLLTSLGGAGNAHLNTAVTNPDLWVYSEDRTGYGNSLLRIPVYYKNHGQTPATDVQLSITLDTDEPYDDEINYQWDTSGISPDCTDGVCTWNFGDLAYLEGGEFDLMVSLSWNDGPWVMSFAIEPSSGDDYPLDNQLEITVTSSEPPLGDPGTVYQYEASIGTLGEPYPIDDEHYSVAAGLGMDSDDNLFMVEETGFRLWKNPQNYPSYDWVVGTPGNPWHHDQFMSYPGDVAVEPGSGHVWVIMNTSLKEFDTDGNFIQTYPAENPWEWGYDNDHLGGRPLGVAFDLTGRLFVADSNNQRIQVFHFNSDPIPAPVWEASIGESQVAHDDDLGFDWPTRIALDSSNNLYVMDTRNNRVQLCTEDISGWACNTFFGHTHEWGAPDDPDRLAYAVGIAIDPTTDDVFIADSSNSRILKCTPGIPTSCETFAEGNGTLGGDFIFVNDVVIDSSGFVYATDNHRLQTFDSAGNFVSVVGTTGVPYVMTTDHYNMPVGIDVDADGNLLIAEELGRRLIKTDSAGNQLWTIGDPNSGGGGDYEFGFNGLQANPAFAPDGSIFVSDQDNNRVVVYDEAGNFIASFGGWGQGQWEFDGPAGIATRPVEDHYETFIVDTWNQRVQVYDDHGYKTTIGWTRVSGLDDRHLNNPRDVAVTDDGIVYIADSDNQRIVKCTSLDGYSYDCSTFYGVTAESRSDSDYFVHLNYPNSVDVDADGRVFVSDLWAERIQVIGPDGRYLTTIGMAWGPDDTSAGDIGTGKFRDPRGVAIDSQGNVWVADQYNQRIQKFSPGVDGWHQINLNGFGWTGTTAIGSAANFLNQVYSGTDTNWGAQIWRTDPLNPHPEVTVYGGFQNWDNRGIDHMLEYKGQLYASTYNYYTDEFGNQQSNGGQIWRSPTGDFGDWYSVVLNGSGNIFSGDPSNNEFMRLFTLTSPDRICATTWTDGSHAAQIWCSRTGDFSSWSSLLGSNDGFGDASNITFMANAVHNGATYLGTYNTASGGEIWRTLNNGSTWTQVNEDGFGDGDNTFIAALAEFNGYLYAATHHNPGAGAEVWRCLVCDNSDWEQVIDNGLGDPTTRRMPGLESINGRLILTIGNPNIGLQVLASESGDSGTWNKIAPDGFGDGNATVSYFDNALMGVNGHVFIGTIMSSGNGAETWLSNETPEGVGDAYSTPLSVPLTVDALNGFLVNDSDFESDELTAELVNGPIPSHGNLDEFNPDGSFTLTPAMGYTGLITFTYRLYDGYDYSDPVNVTVTQTNPSILVNLEADPDSVSSADTVITYTLTVENTGDLSLTGVTPTGTPAITFTLTSGDINSNNILDVDETWTYTATHTVTQGEIDAGTDIQQDVSVDTDQTDPGTDSVSVTISGPQWYSYLPVIIRP